jgi:ATPase family associated with various cellular activities (AAA)/Winged helix domain, variant
VTGATAERELTRADQRALALAVEEVLALLDAHATGRPVTARPPQPPSGALDSLCASFGLTPFERDILVLAAAAELDPTTAARCAAASGDPRRGYPTFSLALAALREPHWSALAPVAPLRNWYLVEPAEDGPVTTARLRIDERILHFLTGVRYLDPRLRGMARAAEPPPTLPPTQQRAADALRRRWTAVHEAPRAELSGADPQTRRDIAASAARASDMWLYTVREADIPEDARERYTLARLWEREAILLPAVLLLEAGQGRAAALDSFASALDVPVVVSCADPLPGWSSPWERIAVPELSATEQRDLWLAALGNGGLDSEALARLVAQFSLPAPVIRTAAATVRRTASGADTAELAWRAGLAEARVALDELGRRIEPRATRADLVLPAAQREILDEIVAHVRRRATVYETWGFEKVLRRGLGVTALFAGGSGTGKTLAAEVVAGELGLDLFVIDLSQIVNKYIGETEKNLRKVFDAAERGGAVLLFDEADALFGKRSEVKDSHDRYANIEVSYLLMRMESYRGLAILTTNMRKALDSAFLRRLRFVVEFPFPGPAERAEIWRRVIPDRVPTSGLDPERLGQLTVTGGSIRNIALSAAFLAADEDEPVRMRHVAAAARAEYLKLERTLGPAEVAGWE